MKGFLVLIEESYWQTCGHRCGEKPTDVSQPSISIASTFKEDNSNLEAGIGTDLLD